MLGLNSTFYSFEIALLCIIQIYKKHQTAFKNLSLKPDISMLCQNTIKLKNFFSNCLKKKRRPVENLAAVIQSNATFFALGQKLVFGESLGFSTFTASNWSPWLSQKYKQKQNNNFFSLWRNRFVGRKRLTHWLKDFAKIRVEGFVKR